MDPRLTVLDRSSDRPSAIARAAAGELLDADDLRSIFGISRATWYRLKNVDAFEPFRVHPPIGARCYSGHLITKYLAGEFIDAPQVLRRRRRA